MDLKNQQCQNGHTTKAHLDSVEPQKYINGVFQRTG